MKIYIVEEHDWDNHANVAIFSTAEAAETYCNNQFGEKDKDGGWRAGYHYGIVEYEVDEEI